MIRPHQVEAFLAPLPVARLPGVGKVMERRLAELGIAVVADLRRLGIDVLEQRFGRWGRRLHELSLGIDERTVEPERPTLQVSAEDTFEHDLPLDELEPHIRRTGGEGLGRLRARTRRAARPPGAHRRAQAQDRRLPHPHPQPHAA